jgi:hypothetical protein
VAKPIMEGKSKRLEQNEIEIASVYIGTRFYPYSKNYFKNKNINDISYD